MKQKTGCLTGFLTANTKNLNTAEYMDIITKDETQQDLSHDKKIIKKPY